MEGRVIKFYRELGVGIISAQDGRKYRFQTSHVMNSHLPIADQEVDFEFLSGRPSNIILLAGSPWTAFGSLEPRQH